MVGAPLRQLRKLVSAGGLAGAAGTGLDGAAVGQDALQLHAYSDQVVLLQLEQLTLAAPAAPVLLQQMQEDLCAVADTALSPACGVPLWMQDVDRVQHIIENSNSVVDSCCGAPSATVQQPQQQTASQAAVNSSPGAGVAAATAASQAQSLAQAQQQQASPQQQSAAAAAGHTSQQLHQRSPARGVAVRHGILLVPEAGSSELMTAPSGPSLRHILSSTAIRQWFKRQIARVAPRRLVIKPGEALGRAPASLAERTAYDAAASGGAAGSGLPAASARVGTQQAAAAGRMAGASGPLVLAAYCLMDFQGLELLAGRMERVQVPALAAAGASGASDAQGILGPAVLDDQAAGLLAGLAAPSPVPPRTAGGTLTGLTYMITRTDVHAAVHEFIWPAPAVPAPAAQRAAAAAAAATSSPTASPAAAAAPVAPTGCSVVALAADDGLALQLSGCGYRYLMATVYGNLMHHQSSFEPYKASGPSHPQHTTFNPSVKFGPSAGQLPYFALTLSSCAVQVRGGCDSSLLFLESFAACLLTCDD